MITYDDITALWRFENNATDEIDSVTGTENGGIVYESGAPMEGSFHLGPGDGIDDFIQIASKASINADSGDFSIIMRAITPAGGDPGFLLSKQLNGGAFQGFNIQTIAQKNPRFEVDGTTSTRFVNHQTDVRGIGEYQLICVYDKSEADGLHVYVNALKSDTTADPRALGSVSNANDMRILNNRTDNAPSKSAMDELYFVKGFVVTQAMATALYNGGDFLSLVPTVVGSVGLSSEQGLIDTKTALGVGPEGVGITERKNRIFLGAPTSGLGIKIGRKN